MRFNLPVVHSKFSEFLKPQTLSRCRRTMLFI